MIGIYKIVNQIGNIYVGQTKNFENRCKSYRGRQCKYQIKLYNSIIKYGWENHYIKLIEECSIELLDEREIFYINYYNSIDRDKGLNLKSGGSRGVLNKESIQKMVIKLRENHIKNPSILKKLNDKSVEKTKGIKRTPEVLYKIKKGKIRNGTLKMKQSSYDKMKETKRRQFRENPEMKLRLIEINKLSSGNIKSVICEETGRIWNSCKEMCEEMGLNITYTRKQLSGSRTNFTKYKYLTKK